MVAGQQASARDRIAGAPISWGVCEVPNWGYQMPAERVLADMQSLGLRATEFGPDGFLPDAPADKATLLRSYGLQGVGGFLPVVLHDPGHDPIGEVDVFADACLASGAGVIVLAAITGLDGYDVRPTLDELQWKTLLGNLDRIAAHAAGRGLLAVIHPHMGTMVEGATDVQRVLDGSQIGLCVDTGHLVAAGADPVAITVANPSRVKHVHLKDVDAARAARVVAGEISFSDAVADGMWTVLGEGSVDVRAMIDALEGSGYQGWYVLEQDLMLRDGEPGGEGPIADVRRCLAFVEKALS
ncbi:TIM barrel protein [Actinoplanes derwentensis]|uniref:2-keto-myo-inositol dehydratase n=1 Tax=Actinoplanes derwentensis TaxID=113562 RepID=A0A1H1V6S7_9ACTN|nr:TIM barrel protein [Actinoplanes derwentensis]GID89251.1 inosose dehydratase [Actinoplanes derwentensis]SDS80514.1 2-keto-myo-inositol dehydratase [Actinoplanes derwentensis]